MTCVEVLNYLSGLLVYEPLAVPAATLRCSALAVGGGGQLATKLHREGNSATGDYSTQSGDPQLARCGERRVKKHSAPAQCSAIYLDLYIEASRLCTKDHMYGTRNLTTSLLRIPNVCKADRCRF